MPVLPLGCLFCFLSVPINLTVITVGYSKIFEIVSWSKFAFAFWTSFAQTFHPLIEKKLEDFVEEFWLCQRGHNEFSSEFCDCFVVAAFGVHSVLMSEFVDD